MSKTKSNLENDLLEVYINRMHCVNCVNTIKSKLKKYENEINFFDLDLNSSKLFISLKDYNILENIKNDIESLGYKFELLQKDKNFSDKDIAFKQEKVNNIFFDKEFVFVLFINFLASIVLIISMFFHKLMINNSKVLYLVFLISSVVYLVGGYRFFRNSYFAIKNGILNMDVLITLSTSSAYFYSVYNFFIKHHNYYFETSSIIISIILLGKYIENRLKSKKIGSITNLLRYKPQKVLVFIDNEVKELSIYDIKEGDIIELRKGDFVPVDGIILEGQALIDLNFIYGEINKINVNVNDKVVSGALIYDGNIKIKAIQNYQHSFWNSLEYLIKNISNKEKKYLSLVDRISGNFVIIVFSLAVLSLIVWKFIFNNDDMAFKSFISTLIVACPCAIGLAYPLAINKGIINSIKNNILVKDISSFEKIIKSKIFVFDKTGTITSDKFIINDLKFFTIYNYENGNLDTNNDFIDNDFINNFVNQALFISTYKSNHILSKTINNFIKEKYKISLYKLLKYHKIIEFKEITSKGIFSKVSFNQELNNKKIDIEYQVYLGSKEFFYENLNKIINNLNFDINENINNKINDKNNLEDLKVYFIIFCHLNNGKEIVFIGYINYQEEIIPKVFELIKFLKDNKKEIYVLTGASKESAINLAKKIGITLDKIFYEVDSVKKYNILTQLKKEGPVVFIGDGINDSLVIKEADVGISFEYGNDLSQNLADVILKDISFLKNFYLISLNTFNKLRFNLFWVFFYNILLIPVAMGAFYGLGVFINPMLASIAMALSSISLLVFNIF